MWQLAADAQAGYVCLQNEAKRFLAALSKRAELRGSEEFTVAELFDMADTLELAVPDVSDFISQLNEAGKHSSGTSNEMMHEVDIELRYASWHTPRSKFSLQAGQPVREV